MSSSGQTFPITFQLVADDQASGALQTVTQVLQEGHQAGSDTIQQFQDLRSQTRLQASALTELNQSYRVSHASLTTFTSAMQSVGAAGQQVLSMVTALSTAQLALEQSQMQVKASSQAVADSQNYYNQMVQQYGANSMQALNALDQLHSNQSSLTESQAQLSRATLQTDLMYGGMALSVVGVGANLITAAGSFSKFLNLATTAAPTMDALQGTLDATAVATTATGVAADESVGGWAALTAVLDANPLILIAAAIAAIIVVLAVVTDGFKNWAPVINAVNVVIGALKTIVTDVWNALVSFGTFLAGVFTAVWSGISTAVTTAWNMITSTLTTVWNGIKSTATTVWNGISTAINVVWSGLEGTATTVWSGISSGITTTLSTLQSGISSSWSSMKSDAQTAWDDYKSLLSTEWSDISTAAKTAWGDIQTGLSVVWNTLSGLWTTFTSGLSTVWTDLWDGMKTAVSTIWTDIQTAVKTGLDALITLVNDFINGIDAMIEALNAIAGTLHLPSLPLIPDIPMLAEGGIVTAPTLAVLGEAGDEAVMPLSSLGMNGGGAGGATVNVYVAGSIQTENQILQAVDRGLYTLQYSRLRS